MTYAKTKAKAPEAHTLPIFADLLEMLTYKRPAKSQTEVDFINRFLMPIPGIQVDGFGNLWVDVGLEEPNIMWSSHTDTVHHSEGRQKLVTENGFVQANTSRRKLSSLELDRLMQEYMETGIQPEIPKGRPNTNCLGADDTTGVWLMMEMIKAGQPGRYVFHREEEIGGNGSRHIAENESHLLKGIDFCIALDRKGYTDIITHQMVGRTASNAFAKSMAKILGGGFKPCDGGTFTDSANYAGIVPECTNLSIGYFDQHGPRESQDLEFLLDLHRTLTTSDFSGLVCERDPVAKAKTKKSNRHGGWAYEDEDEGEEELTNMIDFIFEHPEAIAQWLLAQGISQYDLEYCTEEYR